MVDFRKAVHAMLVLSAATCFIRCSEDVSQSPDSGEKSHEVAHANAQRLASVDKLSTTDVRALVQDFDREPANRAAVPMGSWLLTGDTRETRILIAHPVESYPVLIAALDDGSIHVRRYAAFCIGKLGRRDSIPALQRALRKEIAFATSDRSTGIEWRHAAVDALIQGYGRIDRRDLVEWLLRSSFSPAETTLVNQNLAWLLPGGPSCDRLTVNDCHEQWLLYWRTTSDHGPSPGLRPPSPRKRGEGP